jgi:cytochrome c-type biogenesis protein
MQELFNHLNHAVEGSPALAWGGAFLWGVLSIVLSPCHLASIPLVVGFISGQGRVTAGRACGLASLFAAGILVTIAAIGVVTALAGRMLGDVGRWGTFALAGVLLVVGLHLAGVIPLPWSGPGQVNLKRKGLLAAFILGLVFGIALGPCTFAYMAPMLAIAFKLSGSAPVYAATLLVAYGVGHAAVIVLAGTSTQAVQRLLNWNEQSRGLTALKTACGVLLVIAGIWILYSAP